MSGVETRSDVTVKKKGKKVFFFSENAKLIYSSHHRIVYYRTNVGKNN